MKFTKVTKLLVARGIYAAHALAAVIYTSGELLSTVDIVIVSACLFGLLVETIITIRKSKGEWKWFLPSVPMYLCIIFWCIWKLELTLLDYRMHKLGYNSSEGGCITSCEDFDGTCPDEIEDYCPTKAECEELTTASALIQQTIMLVLIGCRWILPKGEMTRDQLSQLLLVFIGMAADMLEFSSESLKLKQTACDKTLIIIVLLIWCWSLMQFAIGLTATKARKTRVAGTGMGARTKDAVSTVCNCCETEIWAIMTTVVMQDGPYLIMRLYLIFKYQEVDRMMVFFTCKNALLVLLQTYRLYVIVCAKKETPISSLDEEKEAGMAMTVELSDDQAKEPNDDDNRNNILNTKTNEETGDSLVS